MLFLHTTVNDGGKMRINKAKKPILILFIIISILGTSSICYALFNPSEQIYQWFLSKLGQASDEVTQNSDRQLADFDSAIENSINSAAHTIDTAVIASEKETDDYAQSITTNINTETDLIIVEKLRDPFREEKQQFSVLLQLLKEERQKKEDFIATAGPSFKQEISSVTDSLLESLHR